MWTQSTFTQQKTKEEREREEEGAEKITHEEGESTCTFILSFLLLLFSLSLVSPALFHLTTSYRHLKL